MLLVSVDEIWRLGDLPYDVKLFEDLLSCLLSLKCDNLHRVDSLGVELMHGLVNNAIVPLTDMIHLQYIRFSLLCSLIYQLNQFDVLSLVHLGLKVFSK